MLLQTFVIHDIIKMLPINNSYEVKEGVVVN
jgi:hypothetical protein